MKKNPVDRRHDCGITKPRMGLRNKRRQDLRHIEENNQVLWTEKRMKGQDLPIQGIDDGMVKKDG